MKQVERYLCAACWMDIVAAGIRYEEVEPERQEERRVCDWCKRNCCGHTYRIFYGGRRSE